MFDSIPLNNPRVGSYVVHEACCHMALFVFEPIFLCSGILAIYRLFLLDKGGIEQTNFKKTFVICVFMFWYIFVYGLIMVLQSSLEERFTCEKRF